MYVNAIIIDYVWITIGVGRKKGDRRFGRAMAPVAEGGRSCEQR
jgi:hypothetical protein